MGRILVAVALAVVTAAFAEGPSVASMQGGRLEITVDAFTDEVVCAEIAYFENRVGNGVGNGHKLAGVRLRCGFLLVELEGEKHCAGGEQKGADGDN